MDYLTGEVKLDNPKTIKQDQLLLGWLFSSISPIVLQEVSDCDTTHEV